MRTLKKRINNMNFYLNSKGTAFGKSETIRSAQNQMSPRMTQTLDKTRSKELGQIKLYVSGFIV